MSSFKLPKALEPFEFEKIENIDNLKYGDLVVIPSIKDEKRLRVSVHTLRRWGLHVLSRPGQRIGCVGYKAVKRAFANENWYGVEGSDLNAHMFIVEDVDVDTNALREGRIQQFSMSFDNANSIYDPGVELLPTIPILHAKLKPFAPLSVDSRYQDKIFPRLRHYPTSLTTNTDEQAYNILMNIIKGLPYSSIHNNPEEFGDNDFDLKYFLSIVDGLYQYEIMSKLTGIRGHVRASNTTPTCGPVNAASLLMTARRTNDSKDMHIRSYFPNDYYSCYSLSISAPKKFLTNIMKRGALFYRAEKFTKAASEFHASEVAREMVNRYTDYKNAVTKIIKGFESELPNIDNLIARFEKAKTDLSLKTEVKDAMKNICAN